MIVALVLAGGPIVLGAGLSSAVIVAVVQLCKGIGLPPKYAPLVAVGCGVVWALGVQASTLAPVLGDWENALGGGLIVGLTACGLYSGTKSIIRSVGSDGGSQ